VKTGILKTCIIVCDFLSINSTFYTLKYSIFLHIFYMSSSYLQEEILQTQILIVQTRTLFLSDLETRVPSIWGRIEPEIYKTLKLN